MHAINLIKKTVITAGYDCDSSMDEVRSKRGDYDFPIIVPLLELQIKKLFCYIISYGI